MADDDKPVASSSNTEVDQVSPNEPSNSETTQKSAPEDRLALLERARVFLTSPQIVHENPAAKRTFLANKGLSNDEVEMLVNELPPQLPSIPPRTYPQPPPSNLPFLLLGLTKVISWITGGSALLILIYYRILLPRITQSTLARKALKQHQISLLVRMNESLQALKTVQKETFAVLPQPSSKKENEQFKDFHSLDELNVSPEAPIDIPEYTFLRCTIEGYANQGEKLTKEEIFTMFEERYPWFKTDEGMAYEGSLWETLSSDKDFSCEKSNDGREVWTFIAPSPVPESPMSASLSSLRSALPSSLPPTSLFQHTLQTLTDLTGYVTTQTYTFGNSLNIPNLGFSTPLGPQEEEIRREIRALKGLVLNRRSFAPSALRSSPTVS